MIYFLGPEREILLWNLQAEGNLRPLGKTGGKSTEVTKKSAAAKKKRKKSWYTEPAWALTSPR